MKNLSAMTLCILMGFGITTLSGCEQASRVLSSQHPTYSSCLQQAVAGSSNLSADDIRSICAEAAQQPAPTGQAIPVPRLPNGKVNELKLKAGTNYEGAGVWNPETRSFE